MSQMKRESNKIELSQILLPSLMLVPPRPWLFLVCLCASVVGTAYWRSAVDQSLQLPLPCPQHSVWDLAVTYCLAG